MIRFALALALLAVAPALATDDRSCVRELSGRHSTAFLRSSSSELERQTQCLGWEFSVSPRAELLPGSDPAPPPIRIVGPLLSASHANIRAPGTSDTHRAVLGLGRPEDLFGLSASPSAVPLPQQ